RRHEEQTVLAVHNLSDKPVKTALDLGEYAGAEAVDVLDGELLELVGEGTYNLALSRYGYRWVQLR
ncbi:MAG: alpha-glucosidase C-terminal domain-containing protein, partial [Anaerolineae bacterium]